MVNPNKPIGKRHNCKEEGHIACGVAPVKQKECEHKHIYGTYKGIDCNDCLNMSQPPKSKGKECDCPVHIKCEHSREHCQPDKQRDDTEYAKGIIKGREMQYKLDKLGEPLQTDKTTEKMKDEIEVLLASVRVLSNRERKAKILGVLKEAREEERDKVFQEIYDKRFAVLELLKDTVKPIGVSTTKQSKEKDITPNEALDAYRGKVLGIIGKDEPECYHDEKCMGSEASEYRNELRAELRKALLEIER